MAASINQQQLSFNLYTSLPALDTHDAESRILEVGNLVAEIFERKVPAGLSCLELHREVSALHFEGYSEQLFEMLKNKIHLATPVVIENFIRTLPVKASDVDEDSITDEWATALYQLHRHHSTAISQVSQICSTLNGYFVRKTEFRSFRLLCLSFFRDCFLRRVYRGSTPTASGSTCKESANNLDCAHSTSSDRNYRTSSAHAAAVSNDNIIIEGQTPTTAHSFTSSTLPIESLLDVTRTVVVNLLRRQRNTNRSKLLHTPTTTKCPTGTDATTGTQFGTDSATGTANECASSEDVVMDCVGAVNESGGVCNSNTGSDSTKPDMRLASILNLLFDLQLYTTGSPSVESAVLEDAGEYFAFEAAHRLSHSTPAEYIRYVRDRLRLEEEMQFYLHRSTMPRLFTLILDLLVSKPAGDILLLPVDHSAALTVTSSSVTAAAAITGGTSTATGNGKVFAFDNLIMEENYEVLEAFYELYNIVHKTKLIQDAFTACIKRRIWSIFIELAGSGTGGPPQQDLHVLIRTHYARSVFSVSPEVSVPAEIQTAMSNFQFAAGREAQRQLAPLLIKFHGQVCRCLSNAFNSADSFQIAMQAAWQETINANTTLSNNTAKLLARYCDEALWPASSSRVVESRLSQVIGIFRFLQSKDYFEAFYRKDLGRRMLTLRTESRQAEKIMIQSLKDECGAPYTTKLEGMFKELAQSSQIFNQFSRNAECRKLLDSSAVLFHCHVVAAAIWPCPLINPLAGAEDTMTTSRGGSTTTGAASSRGAELAGASSTAVFATGNDGDDITSDADTSKRREALPELIKPPNAFRLESSFVEFYKKRHPDRVLQWVSALGTCVIRAVFPSNECAMDDAHPKWHELVLSQIQGVALLLFNEEPSLLISDLCKSTGVSAKELFRQLLALSVDKRHKILLRKTPKAKVLPPSSSSGGTAVTAASGTTNNEVGNYELTAVRFSVNSKFSSEQLRIAVTQIHLKETRKETQATEQRVEEDRSFLLDAAIVKVMKAHRSLTHANLIAGLFAAVQFKTTSAAVKARIESLIGREFLQRDSNDPQLYHYVA